MPDLESDPLLGPQGNQSNCMSCSSWTKKFLVMGFLLACAAVLSMVLPVGTHLPCPYCRVSSMLGWTYFLMWTISFYPQLIVNFRRKSVEGLSLDFTLMNVAGFLCYSIFNLSLVLSPKVKEEYQHRFGTVGVPVELNDVLFGLHALLLSSALAVQCVVYPKASGQRVSFNTKLGLAVSAGAGLAYAGFMAWEGEGEAPWTWLDLSYFCSFIKMGVTLVKYIPQVHLNLSRQSTEGWSIDNVLLDLGGGVLSLAQLFVSCMVLHDWSAVTGNPIKMGLGMASLGFDVIFILQHYVWYREAGAAADTSEGVLSRKSSLEHEDHLEPLLPAAAVSHAHALV